MADTIDEQALERLKQVIHSGASETSSQGETVKLRPLAELKEIRADLESDIASSSPGRRRKKLARFVGTRGF